MSMRSKDRQTCSICDEPLRRGERFCPHCGAEQAAVTDGQPARTRRILWVSASLLLLAAIIGGALIKVSHDREVERKRAAALAKQKKIEAQQAEHDACEKAERRLLDALKTVDGKLDVGMTFRDYNDAVGDVSVAYNNQTAEDLEGDCLGDVAVPAEAAFNQYAKASNKWNKCIQDYDCDTDDLDLQRYWTRASIKVDEAELGLSDMEP